MRTQYLKFLLPFFLIVFGFNVNAQGLLNVSVTNTSDNTNLIQINGTATGSGFSSGTYQNWGTLNITVRFPKSAAVPAPTVSFGALTPEVTNEMTNFTGPAPRDAITGNFDISIFQSSDLGLADDGFWYLQLVQTNPGGNQVINSGSTVLLYQFQFPSAWSCPGCVQILTTEVPGFPISTRSFIDNNGGGTVTNVLNVVTNNAPLPIRLSTFTGVAKECNTLLKWTTEVDEENGKFEIQKSADGIDFRTMTTVVSKGRPSAYESNVSQSSATAYYRLKIVDRNGEIKYSPVIIVRTNCSGTAGMILNVFPNPAKNGFTVNFFKGGTGEKKVELHLTNGLGQVVARREVNITDFESYYFDLKESYIVAGDYLLNIYKEKELIDSKKIIVQR